MKTIDCLANIFAFFMCLVVIILLAVGIGNAGEVHFKSNHVGETRLICLLSCISEATPPTVPVEVDCLNWSCPQGSEPYLKIVSIDQSTLQDTIRQLREINSDQLRLAW